MTSLDQIINTIAPDSQGKQLQIKLFEYVRDIPYGSIGSRDPLDVYKANEGTCSGKHELLKILYNHIGIKTEDYIAMHKFIDLPVKFPPQISQILQRSDILDPHNFFKANIEGEWLDIDLTWDLPLKKHGFIVTENWDATTSMPIAVKVISIHKTQNPMEFKKTEIAKLSQSIQADRKLFLDELTKWVKLLRTS